MALHRCKQVVEKILVLTFCYKRLHRVLQRRAESLNGETAEKWTAATKKLPLSMVVPWAYVLG